MPAPVGEHGALAARWLAGADLNFRALVWRRHPPDYADEKSSRGCQLAGHMQLATTECAPSFGRYQAASCWSEAGTLPAQGRTVCWPRQPLKIAADASSRTGAHPPDQAEQPAKHRTVASFHLIRHPAPRFAKCLDTQARFLRPLRGAWLLPLFLTPGGHSAGPTLRAA